MADFSYTQYRVLGNGRVQTNIGQVTISDADGQIAVGNTFSVGGTTFKVDGLYASGPYAGDFSATTSNGTAKYYFSSVSNLPDNFDTDASAGYSTTSGASTSLTCFRPGTLITTERGEVAVEDIQVGDRLPTADGRIATVRWLAKQTVATIFAPKESSFPICIRAGALGESTPRRDLYVSPGHALLVDGRLVNAAALVNGTSIVQVADMPARFEYFHIETDGHHAIFAEGAPAETYLDNTPRQAFDNWQEHAALDPGSREPITPMDLPRVSARRLLPAETRARLEFHARRIGMVRDWAA